MFETRVKSHHSGHPKRSTFSSENELFSFLDENLSEQKQGVIYFHVPFCDNICSFCSMNRTKLDEELDEYTEYLLAQIDAFSERMYIKAKSFESVYFGGGTPTILKQKHLERILTAINEKFNLSSECEFNFESTLHNLSLSKLKMMSEFGVNRFSIGIQTFNERGRKLLNRVHNSKNAIEHLSKLRENFNGLLCTDIIYNYPEQSVSDVIEDAKIVKSLGIDSTSFYSLIFFQGSELAKSIDPNYYDLQTDKNLHHAFVDEMFSSDEYEYMELTKIAKKGRDKYKYIRLTHAGVDILPLGVGAGGGIADYGIYNMKKTMKMVGILPKADLEFKKFSALFQYVDVKFDDMKKYISDDTFKTLLEFFKKCENNGLLSINDTGYTLSKDGVFWGNSMSEEISKMVQKDFE
ncbi:Anaerobilin synthase [Campylobacter majalis]|uniref:Anaerobilin synthase n=1 Tax=Campylobacter majalis TaxID=2790656 RepID=A0ABN7KA24_9BACT|nr:radical SAM protein [Campylobacter majalis]CAD7287617.1 Anaerobilin synthase [Campylobacter majalis]